MFTFLHFHSADGSAPALLRLNLVYNIINCKKIVISCSRKTKASLIDKFKIIDYVNKIDDAELYFEVAEMQDIISQRIVHEYLVQIERGTITSNHVPTEIHCIYRWIGMQYAMRKHCANSAFSIDWDTFVNIDISCLIGAENPNLVMYLHQGVRIRNPIWSICPNFVYASEDALSKYIYFFSKHVATGELGGYALEGNFSDMQTWSSVYSNYLRKDFYSARSWDEIVTDNNITTEHNMICELENGIKFEMANYSIEGGLEKYRGKRIDFDLDSLPITYIIGPSDDLVPKIPLTLHYQGTSAKKVLMQIHARHYLASILLRCRNIDRELRHTVPEFWGVLDG